jgi:prophage regulatory protein
MLQTVKQVAQRLSVTPPTVWRFCRTDSSFPKPIKLSAGTTRWRADEIESWLDSRPK